MKKIILTNLLFLFCSLAVYSGENAEDVTVNFNVDEKLSGKSKNSYAITIERLMLFYGSKVNFAYLESVNTISFEALKDFGSVNGRMEHFVDFSKHAGRSAGLKIKKYYLMKDSMFRKLLRKYNSKAKKGNIPTLSLKGQRTRWFYEGVRKEFLQMNQETRKQAREKTCNRKFAPLITRLINKGIPVVWAPVFGSPKIEDIEKLRNRVKNSDLAPIYIISGYNEKTQEIIYLDLEKAEPKRMKYEDAWGMTTGIYTIKPRVVK